PQLAQRPDHPRAAYAVRPLVSAPDPTLTDVTVPETRPEPALPIDPEWIRMSRVSQPVDLNGASAMQKLRDRAEQGNCYLVPLPKGVDESSPELFNMYTYE